MTTRAVFVSPHLDDAVLSCGGGIARLVRDSARVTVVTVFTADAPSDQPLSPVARRMHASWAAGSQPFSVRRAEDDAALRLLGAQSEHLGLLDAIYRRSPGGTALYASPFAAPLHHDLAGTLPQLVAALEASAAASPDAVVFCPAGTGGHVDHVLTRRAAEQVVEAERLVYYDEYPYSARIGPTAATGGPGPAAHAAHTLPLTAEELDARIAAIACYTSQLRGLFPSRAEVWREVASARIPGMGRLLAREPDMDASRARMASRVTRSVTAIGGERYWWAPENESPFSAQ